MGAFADVSGVGLLENDAPASVGDAALQGAAASHSADGVGRSFRQADAEDSGEVEVVPDDLAREPAIGSAERFHGDIDGVAFFNGDRGFLCEGGRGGEKRENQAGGEFA